MGHHAKCEGMVEQTWRDKSDRLAGWLAHGSRGGAAQTVFRATQTMELEKYRIRYPELKQGLGLGSLGSEQSLFQE